MSQENGLVNFVAESCGDEKPLSESGSSNSLEQSGEEASGFSIAQLARSIIRWSVSNALLLTVSAVFSIQRKYIRSCILRMLLNDSRPEILRK